MEEIRKEDLETEKDTTVDELEDVQLDINCDNNASDDIENKESYPVNVRVDKAQFSIMHLRTLCEKRNDIILNPEFQRNEVWKQKQSSELIESILIGIPLPLIYLFENNEGKKQVVDGKQRIGAILNFLNEKFKLTGLKVLNDLNGKKFTELELKMQGQFEDFQLSFYIIQPPTPEKIKYDIFDRINRGGTTLNKQEMRNALYLGKATELIDVIAKENAFKEATGGSLTSKRMKDKYAILRAIAFLMLKRGDLKEAEIDYRSDMDEFLAKVMMFINEKTSDELIEKYKGLVIKAFEDSFRILNDEAFRFATEGNVAKKRPINMSLLEILVYFFISYFTKGIDITETERLDLRDRINDKKVEFDKTAYFRANADSKSSVDARFKLIDDLLKNIKEKKND